MTDKLNDPAAEKPTRYEFTFRVEVISGQDMRIVEADSYHADDYWVRFYRCGSEYWIINRNQVVSMETRRND